MNNTSDKTVTKRESLGYDCEYHRHFEALSVLAIVPVPNPFTYFKKVERSISLP